MYCLRRQLFCDQPVLPAGLLAAYHLLDHEDAWWDLVDRTEAEVEASAGPVFMENVEPGDFTP